MIKIAVLGPEGTFTDEAARRQFKKGDFRYYNSITRVFQSVASENYDYGVVPIENSIEGSVSETIDCLKKYKVFVWGEVYHKISHVLAGVGEIKDIKRIRSHPQALRQCMNTLEIKRAAGKIPKTVTEEDYSTAGAMESVAKLKDPAIAAIGSRNAAERYGLKILISNLSDMEDNETRFFVISKQEAKRTGKDKTSIIVAVKDEAGALYNLLGVFSKASINLTKIESRPSKDRKWEYMFLIDFEGHKEDVGEVLKRVEGSTTYYKLLGSYPRG